MLKNSFLFPPEETATTHSGNTISSGQNHHLHYPTATNVSPLNNNKTRLPSQYNSHSTHLINTSISEETLEDYNHCDFMKSPLVMDHHQQHLYGPGRTGFTKPTMSHFNANNDSYNSINSIDTDSIVSSSSVFSTKMKRLGSQSSIHSSPGPSSSQPLCVQPPPNPFANFDSQMISPISSSFDKGMHAAVSPSPQVKSNSHQQHTYPRPRLSFHHSPTSISSLNFSLNNTLSSSSINLGSTGSTSPQLNKKFTKYPIPQGVQPITNSQLEALISEEGSDDKLLIIDVRSYLEFNRAHIKNSINFNLPSTLLKRPNYTLKRCLNNITSEEKTKLTEFLDHTKAQDEIRTNAKSRVLVYDDFKITNDEIPLTVHGVINKFLEFEEYDGEVLLLRDGFHSFREDYCQLITVATSTLSKGDTSLHSKHVECMPMPTLSSRSLSLANLPSATTTEFGSPPGLSKLKLPTSSKVTEFSLPVSTIFKIRHNEEVLHHSDSNDRLILKDFSRVLKNLSKEEEEEKEEHESKIPDWLQKSIKTESGLFSDFRTLEIQEKNHINSLMCTNSLSFGIELGYKNRYKDIFPYECTRVKLSSDTNFYLNGSTIDSSRLGFEDAGSKYITTQAPLTSTMDDFVKVITESQIGMIVTLTDQFEYGMEKCHAYWDDIQYFHCLSTTRLSDNLILRKLQVISTGWIVWQFHVLNWFDFDVINNHKHLMDLLTLIRIKSELISNGKINPLTLVHCSAGCGRTGTYCTIDTIVSNVDMLSEIPAKNDLVFRLVENFRAQRMSMVQNVRQYLFIYEVLVYYFEDLNSGKKEVEGHFNQVNKKLEGLRF